MYLKALTEAGYNEDQICSKLRPDKLDKRFGTRSSDKINERDDFECMNRTLEDFAFVEKVAGKESTLIRQGSQA